MIAYIFLTGEIEDYNFFEEYKLDSGTIICADAGYYNAKKLDIIPDYIIGDMDSIKKAPFSKLWSAKLTEDCSHNAPPASYTPQIIKYPAEKDYTDGQMAVKLAAEIGCNKIVIFGALGNESLSIEKSITRRFDHILGNIYLLKLAQSLNLTAKIAEPDCEIILIQNKAQIERKNFKYVSFLPLTPAVKGVTLTGLKYPLNNAEITQSNIITMSNEFVEDVAGVTVEDGELLAIMSA